MDASIPQEPRRKVDSLDLLDIDLVCYVVFDGGGKCA